MSIFDGVEVISSYTRAQAIEDGVLVDLNQGELGKLTQEAGFKFPLACTMEVFVGCIELTPAAKLAGCDIKGRLWDILQVLRMHIRRLPGNVDRIEFKLAVVNETVQPTTVDLVAVCGPGDDLEPTITIMYPWQD